MSKVKDQKACGLYLILTILRNDFLIIFTGSCWAFASLAVLEYNSIKNKKPQIYSEQNLVDCDTYSDGCEGGHPITAFYYTYNKGISDGTKYTYTAKKGSCRRSQFPSIYKSNQPCSVDLKKDENLLKMVVAAYGRSIMHPQNYHYIKF